MSMKTKLLIFILSLTLVFSLFVIPSFAITTSFNGLFTFNDVLEFTDNDVRYNLEFIHEGVQYSGLLVSYRGNNYLSFIIDEDDGTSTYVDVYSQSGGWYYDVDKTIRINDEYISNSTILFLNANEFSSVPDPEPEPTPEYNGWYFDIYDMLREAIFGDFEIDGYQAMALSLISVTLCFVTVCMPIIVCLYVGKHLLSLRWW